MPPAMLLIGNPTTTTISRTRSIWLNPTEVARRRAYRGPRINTTATCERALRQKRAEWHRNSSIAPTWSRASGVERVDSTFGAKMIRLIIAASCLFALLPAPSSACDGSDCNATARVRPTEIARFMREQAASTRAMRPLTEQSKRVVVRHSRPRPKISLVAARPKAAQPAFRRLIHSVSKTAIPHSRGGQDEPHLVASSFAAAQESSVEVVTRDELSAIDRAAGLGGPLPMDQTAFQAVTEAFDEIDRRRGGSLTEDDLRAASERAQVKQTESSWLQQIWSTLTAPFAWD